MSTPTPTNGNPTTVKVKKEPSPTPTTSNTATSTSNASRLIEEMSAADLEAALTDTFSQAKKLAWNTEEATPDALLAILAMYAIQEVHACGYRPPSAIRAMVMKIKNTEKVATITCLRQAKRELIRVATEARGGTYQERPRRDHGQGRGQANGGAAQA